MRVIKLKIPEVRMKLSREELYKLSDEELQIIIKEERWLVNREIVKIANKLFIDFHNRTKEYRESEEGKLHHRAISTIALIGWE